MKTYILDFFDDSVEIPVEYHELKNNYLLEIKEIKNDDCDQCKKKEIRKKYIKILLEYDI
jgi:hypothetical protein